MATPLIERIDAFCKKHKMTPTEFGKQSIKDPNLIFQMKDAKKPRSLTQRTAEKIEDFMKKYDDAKKAVKKKPAKA